MVSGDTGPLHIAAAVGTPIVAIFGPTDPARNGPWTADDITLSRFGQCVCHYRRRCRRARACIEDIAARGCAWSHRPTPCRSPRPRPDFSAAAWRACACRSGSCGAAAVAVAGAARRGSRLAVGAAVVGGRRGDAHLGGRPPREGPRGHHVRAVSLDRPSALPRVHGDRARESRWRRAALGRRSSRPVPRADAGRGDPERGGGAAREVRARVRRLSGGPGGRTSRGASAWRGRSATASTGRWSACWCVMILLALKTRLLL